MSADEIAKTKRLIAALRLPDDAVRTRRFLAGARGRVDPRRTFRRSLRAGGAVIDLAFRSRTIRARAARGAGRYLGLDGGVQPPVPALPARGRRAAPLRAFLRVRDAPHQYQPRIGEPRSGRRPRPGRRARAGLGRGHAHRPCLHAFNRLWSRRVLSQGATVLLFTDGLERQVTPELAFEMDRLKRSCRRLVWLNPLLRFDAFEARAAGIRAMLPHVHDFRPIHNLASMDDLCRALGADRAGTGGLSGCAKPAERYVIPGRRASVEPGTHDWVPRSAALRLLLGSGLALRAHRNHGGFMLASDSDILKEAEAWRRAGRGVALATVVETWGSAPRPVGSHLVIDEEGNFLGSVSGGCVEGAVITDAVDVIADGKPRILEFGVADETAWRVGLSCGGRIKVYVERVD